ncbi:extracellular ligand-binding receptor [Natrinema pellirubrum DSM 15624]|uniref:Extracellular ligand-binding receptor n=1 Tax=Natrinema pellirubrum (strain DSM 15624 / CIP 106293 / JCM 10476 / NCIMB 786 / 157) TaxID=797303 RepID=L9YS78_NATP1|nr:extracellular ligand-binding receptor [Natrinema pellirubrum DSM 15624]
MTTALAGCLGGVDGGGSDDGVFKIGHLAPTANPNGIGSERSAELAVGEIEDDGVLDQEVELIAEDTQGDTSEATSEVERMIEQENIDLLVGTFASEVTQSIADYVGERNVPFLISGSADPDTITENHGEDYDTFKNIFRVGPLNSELQVEGFGDYAEYLNERHGWTDFAVLPEDAAWTTSFQDGIADEFEDRGFNVVYENTSSTETEDYTPFFNDIEEAGADALFRFFAHSGQGPDVGAWSQGEYEFALEGTHVASMSPEFYGLTEGASLYESTNQSGAGGITDLSDKTGPFVEAYEEEYADDDAPSKPMYMGFNTYDAIHLYKEAAEEAGTVNYGEDLDTIVDTLQGMSYTGTAGKIEFFGEDEAYPNDLKPTRDDSGKIENFPITQWQGDGTVECVYPSADQTADHVAPEWM